MPESRSIRALRLSLPSVISVTLHVFVFALIAVTPWTVHRESQNKGLVIAATSLGQGAENTQFDDPRDTEQSRTEEQSRNEGQSLTAKQEWTMQPAENLLRDVGDRQSSGDPVITLGSGGSGAGTRLGGGTGAGPTEAGGGRMTMRAGSQGPRFFGQGGGESLATRIVYVVDRSGSMINTFDALVRELERSIGELNVRQSFHVVFFSERTPIENPPRKLVPAIKANKKQAFDFLRTIVPEGRTDPAEAMQRAFDLKPEIIFFLTDGEFSPDLLEKLDKWNKNRQVKIYTYAYVYQPGKALLERIAREHGGKYKFISEDEIFK
jgi:hypothetical protein